MATTINPKRFESCAAFIPQHSKWRNLMRFYPNKKIYHFATLLFLLITGGAFALGIFIGHGIMLAQCQDIMASDIPVPEPLIAFVKN